MPDLQRSLARVLRRVALHVAVRLNTAANRLDPPVPVIVCVQDGQTMPLSPEHPLSVYRRAAASIAPNN